MKKKLLTLAFATLVFSIPLLSVVNGLSISHVLKDLRSELRIKYTQRSEEQKQFDKNYEREHKRMVDIITSSNELSILLYTQEQGKTFDLAYSLNKVSSAFKDFSKESRPYARSVHELDVEVDRYARLIEALRRLPPLMTEIELELVPDSLLYHNDSLDWEISEVASSLEKEVIRIAIRDSLASPFVLDTEGEIHRDSCIRYASGLLKMHAANRAKLMADSSHYRSAYLRMKEAYDYAQSRYKDLEKYVFVDGQASYLDILSAPSYYWGKVKKDLNEQYNFLETSKDEPEENSATANESDESYFDSLPGRQLNFMLVALSLIQLFALGFFWGIAYLLLWLLGKWDKVNRFFPQKKRTLLAILVGTVIYFLLLGFGLRGNEYINIGVRHINTFLWLLIAISGSLLLRVKSEQILRLLLQGSLAQEPSHLPHRPVHHCLPHQFCAGLPADFPASAHPGLRRGAPVVFQHPGKRQSHPHRQHPGLDVAVHLRHLLCVFPGGLHLPGPAHPGVVVFPTGRPALHFLPGRPGRPIQGTLAGQAHGRDAQAYHLCGRRRP